MDFPCVLGPGRVAPDRVATASILIPMVDLLPGTVFTCF